MGSGGACMVRRIRSLGLGGVEGFEVAVECSVAGGLPALDMVGLPDAAVKEAKERVRSAIRNCGFSFPMGRITLNLAPANTRKSGTVYDLPILLGILTAGGELELEKNELEDSAFLGELSLEGKLSPVEGVLPMALAAQRLGIKKLYVPADNAPEATLAQDIEVYAVSDVHQLACHLTGVKPLLPAQAWAGSAERQDTLDFRDVVGQDNVKRAMEVAAAGSHNILLVGPPGSGKSMLARRLPSILPDMTRDEAISATKIHSVMGLVNNQNPLLTDRPFRSPHHTISFAGMAGGGTSPKPGEISLAHNGVLFLDELPEFHRDVLEILRQPLEEGQITISRAGGSVTYPSSFMLVCAMNPCKCGWYGHPSGRCTCTQSAVDKYLSRISGPLLDRIDLIIEVPSVEFQDLSRRAEAEPSASIRRRVNQARDIQTRRYAGSDITCNAHMDSQALRSYCRLDETCTNLMQQAFDRLRLTARSYDRILKVARTIADLENAEQIGPTHLAEAIQYRTSDLSSR